MTALRTPGPFRPGFEQRASPDGRIRAGIDAPPRAAGLGLEQSGQLVAVGRDDVGQPEDRSVDPDRRRRVQDGRRARGMAAHQGLADDVERHLVADEHHVAGQRAEPARQSRT
jgi:hypothetical protein